MRPVLRSPITMCATAAITASWCGALAPGFGIAIGWVSYLRDVSVTDNLIRNAHIGIGVSTDPSAGTALITDNLITGSNDGAIRAMNGPTPIGPDLAHASAEAYRNLAVYSNVAR